MAERIIGYVKGPQGDAATVSVGSTTTLPAGSQATVTNSGTSSAATLNFGIPKGDKGDPGTPGVSDYATDQTAGLVRLSNDFSINPSNGVLSLMNDFTKAASLAALVSQEAFATSMGKIAKAVDTVITIAGDYLKSTDIVDSLTSSLATKALSAKQGKALKDGLDSLNDSLSALFATRLFSASYTAPANGSINISGTTLGYSAPTGYKPVCLVDFYSGSGDVVLKNYFLTNSGEDTVINLRNVSNSSITASAQIRILFAKSTTFSN